MEISRIDISKRDKKLLKKINLKKTQKELLSQNKDNLKISAFNIDSRFRNKNPKNIVDKNKFYLEKNSIKFTTNSSIVELKINNENEYFDVNDRIIIENFSIPKKIYRNNIYLIPNFNYMAVYLKNHNYKPSVELQQLSIRIINEIEDNLGNIPANILKEISTVRVSSELNIPEEIRSNFDNVEDDFIFLELPIVYNGNAIFKIENVFEFTFYSVAGIPVKYINADYPVNYNRNKGFHQIIDVSNESIFIDININANNNISFNETGVFLGKIIKTLEGFVDPSYYIVNLPKNFHNVVRIELVSSEFFFIDTLIKDSGINKNNKLYWQNIEDGDEIYSIELESGNYTPTNMVNDIIIKTNNLRRKNFTDENPSYNNFEINLDTDKNFISFSSFKIEVLPESISIELVEIDSNFYYQLTVVHPGNFVEVNDVIEISNCNSIDTVPVTVINISHIVYKVNKNFQSYSVILPRFTPNQTKNSGNGGNAITVKSKNLTRFLFDKSDTIGEILGFKNVGEENSITKFSHVTTNRDEYVVDKKINSIGNVDTSINFFNFSGENLYLLMYLNDYQSIFSNTNIDNPFAKILLPGSLGEAVFNTFVNYPVEFDIPIPNIEQFVVRFKYPDGSAPEFNNLDHSFTLLITEKNESHEEIGTQSKKSSFTKKLYEIRSNEF